MLRQVSLLVCAGTMLSGCRALFLSPVERVIDRHYVLEKKDAGLLEGPYRMERALAPDRVVLRSDGKEIEVMVRGCKPVGEGRLDFESQGLLARMQQDRVYLRTDCKVVLGENTLKAVVYTAANTRSTMDEKGNVETEILTYRMPQLLGLLCGYCLLDRTDTNYPLYEVFLKAEELAREYREGYWKTHSE